MAATIQDAIMLFGDSITQGSWEQNGLAARLAHSYVRQLDVINRGFSGYNTEWAIPVFEQVFAKQSEQPHVPKVRLLTIWFGANDAALPMSPQHVPLDKYKANLKHLISMIRSPKSAYYSPSTRILIISPPPVNTNQWQMASDPPKLEPDRKFEVTKTYAQTAVQVAKEEGVGLVDAWTALWDAAGHDEKALSNFSYDGLHLNSAGYEVVYNALMKTIEQNHPDLHYDSFRFGIARWDEVDSVNFRESVKLRSIEIPKN